MQLYFILSLVTSILVVIFAVTNAAAVPVKVFFVEYNFSLALIIFISAAFGAVIATMIGLVKQFKLSKQIRKLHHDNQALTEENNKLKEEIASKGVPQVLEAPIEENQAGLHINT